MSTLRPEQAEAIEQLRQSLRQGKKSIVLVQPCGSGKTVVAAHIIRSSLAKKKRVLFLAPRRELITQAQGEFAKLGIDSGIIMAGKEPSLLADVQIASFDTLHARAVQRSRIQMPMADVAIVDESHLSLSRTKMDIINHYRSHGAVVIGLTATPARGDGRGLGELYDDMVIGTDVAELTEQGHLVPARYFAPSKPDLDGVKTRMGDYVESELAGRMDKVQLIGDIVENWIKIAYGKSTVVFCVNRAHARHVYEEFTRVGVLAEYLDGETPTDERDALLKRIEDGKSTVLVNVFVATYGLNVKRLEVAVLARPTRNITLYLQTVGRVLRTFLGKESAIVIDHAGCVDEHGFVTDGQPWSLDGKTTVKQRKEEQQKERKEPKEITCSQCKTVFKSRRDCPNCGHQMIPPGKEIPCHEADLKEINPPKKADMDAKAMVYGMLRFHALERGYAKGWAYFKYREYFGHGPGGKVNHARPVPPSPDVLSWIRSKQIQWAKSKKRQEERPTP